MKFIQGLCEAVTRALGLSALTPWDHDPQPQQLVGPHFGVKPIQGKEILQPGRHAPKPLKTQPPQPLETLFPSDPFRHASNNHRAPSGEREEEISLQNQKLPVGQSPDTDLEPGPIFSPPNSSPGFLCDYTAMRGWKHVGGSTKRNNWLEKPIMDSDATGGIYNIFTNYDQYSPIGTLRQVSFPLTSPPSYA